MRGVAPAVFHDGRTAPFLFLAAPREHPSSFACVYASSQQKPLQLCERRRMSPGQVTFGGSMVRGMRSRQGCGGDWAPRLFVCGERICSSLPGVVGCGRRSPPGSPRGPRRRGAHVRPTRCLIASPAFSCDLEPSRGWMQSLVAAAATICVQPAGVICPLRLRIVSPHLPQLGPGATAQLARALQLHVCCTAKKTVPLQSMNFLDQEDHCCSMCASRVLGWIQVARYQQLLDQHSRGGAGAGVILKDVWAHRMGRVCARAVCSLLSLYSCVLCRFCITRCCFVAAVASVPAARRQG